MTILKSPATLGQANYVRLIRLPEVLRITALSKSEWYRRIANGTAPAAIKLGVRASAWLESDVSDWVKSRVHGGRV